MVGRRRPDGDVIRPDGGFQVLRRTQCVVAHLECDGEISLVRDPEGNFGGCLPKGPPVTVLRPVQVGDVPGPLVSLPQPLAECVVQVRALRAPAGGGLGHDAHVRDRAVEIVVAGAAECQPCQLFSQLLPNLFVKVLPPHPAPAG